jgi:hypothetical protein
VSYHTSQAPTARHLAEPPQSAPREQDRPSITRYGSESRDGTSATPASQSYQPPYQGHYPEFLSTSARPIFTPTSSTGAQTPASTYTNPPTGVSTSTVSAQTSIPAHTGVSRTPRSLHPHVPTFQSTLNPRLRAFAALPRARLPLVFQHLRENLDILREDPEAIFREAVAAFEYYNNYNVTDYGDKRDHGENCLQQYILLKLLQRSTRGGSSAARVVDLCETALNTDRSKLRTFLEEVDRARAAAKEQAQRRRLTAADNTASNSPSRSDRPDRGGDGGGSAAGYPAAVQGITTGLAATTLQARSSPGANSTTVSSPFATNYATGKEDTSRASQALSASGAPANPSTGLNANYQKRHAAFYQLGRVFAVLVHESYSREPSRYIGGTRYSVETTTGRFEVPIYSTIRRYIVSNATRVWLVVEKSPCCI